MSYSQRKREPMVDYDSAAQAVQDKNADPAFLALIAYENPEFGPNVAANPRAYPGLLAWLACFGTPEAKRVVAQRIGGQLPKGAAILERNPKDPLTSTDQSTASNRQNNETQDDAAQSTHANADGSVTSAAGDTASQPSNDSPRNAVVVVSTDELTTPVNGYTAAQALDPMTDPMTQHDIAQNAPQLRPYLARNPNIYPELLSWLASLPDDSIRRAIAERKTQR
ncbi:MAG: hypothetical protein IIT36_03885 [Aeriscardovia sp.]|nr:hypothetical protein [Aeriscardovia sp.]